MIYAIHDYDPELKKRGCIQITKDQAPEYNKAGWGIFWTPNKFNGARKEENLVKINFWMVDIDGLDKPRTLDRLLNAILSPSMVVETKNGYHAYWKAQNASEGAYRRIQSGLIKTFKGDPACKDVARLLRVPGFFHQKDPNEPFMIECVHRTDKSFKESMMRFCYEEKPKPVKKLQYDGDKEDLLEKENWDRIFKLNHIGEGGRNNNFSRIAFWLRDEGFSQDIVMNTLERMNAEIANPLDSYELKQIVRSKF